MRLSKGDLFENKDFSILKKALAELFAVKRPAITKHRKNIVESGELDEKVVASILEDTTPDSLIGTHCSQVEMEIL